MSTIHLSVIGQQVRLTVMSYCRNWRRKRLLCLQWIYLECQLSCSAANVCDHHSMSLSLILLRYRYEKYAQKNGWKFDVIDIMESAVKGYKVQPLLVLLKRKSLQLQHTLHLLQTAVARYVQVITGSAHVNKTDIAKKNKFYYLKLLELKL